MFGGSSTPLKVDGRNIRVDPSNMKPEDFPSLDKLPDAKKQRRFEMIKAGAEEMTEFPNMPDERPCQDVVWLGLFCLTVLATFSYGAISLSTLPTQEAEPAASTSGGISPQSSERNVDAVPTVTVLLCTIMASSCASIVAALGYIFLLHNCAKIIVWASLIFAPLMTVGLGIYLLISSGPIAGLICMGGGLMLLMCTFCCWRHLIPFMIQLAEVVADVITHHPCMITIGLIGTILGILWVLACGCSLIAIAMSLGVVSNDPNGNSNGDKNQYSTLSFIFVAALIFVWGSQVISNVCHVTYCGVYARWYYGTGGGSASDESGNDENTLAPSLKVAMTTSFGSVCKGSFLVALVRAVQQTVKSAGEGEQNPVVIVIMCLIECLIACIGDMLEYFNDWAYVQCATRGVNFCGAAKITLSMLTCANVQYIMSDILLDSLVNMGTLLIAIVSALVGGITGFALGGSVGAMWGGIGGLLIGFLAGSAALGMINSGVKTILACWADDPRPLEESHPEVHEQFNQRLETNLGKLGQNKS